MGQHIIKLHKSYSLDIISEQVREVAENAITNRQEFEVDIVFPTTRDLELNVSEHIGRISERVCKKGYEVSYVPHETKEYEDGRKRRNVLCLFFSPSPSFA